MIFLCRAINNELNPQKNEVRGLGWFSFDQIKKLNTFENVISTITHAMEYICDNPIQ